MARRTPQDRYFEVWELLEAVCDPEIPVVNLREMGILRAVRSTAQTLEVILTPTYNGCPAVDQMHDDVASTLARAGLAASVRTCIAPAWSSDWLTPQAHDKLRHYVIAPPGACAASGQQLYVLQFAPINRAADAYQTAACPRCGSENTTCTSPFGSTACKALYRCLDCAEPFDYFKPY
ncbi:MAG: phenylacetate-CoA oxygenase subunit PaaJ [Rhodoferax sp.]|nr:phenylacetate-CoA oxygenase subunit PaaJ [Rhodoferax sp.]